MKAKIFFILLSGLAITGFSSLTYADNGYYSAQVQPGGNGSVGSNGYSSSGNQGAAGNNGYSSSGSHGSVGTNGYSSSGSHQSYFVGKSFSTGKFPHQKYDIHYVYGHGWHRYKDARWVNRLAGGPIPRNAIVGGHENNHPVFVCRGNWRNGVHPGKVVGQTCHISYGGKEITLPHFQILVSKARIGWIRANRGFVPSNAIQGGYEQNRSLYICQAAFNGGMYPGKLVGKQCNIAWGGKEIAIPEYNVLVR